MTVYFIGAGPGDPELLTRKAERLLRVAPACVYAGSLVAPEILELLPAGAELHDSAAMTLAETTDVCAAAHARGLDVARLHSGDPSIYGAIGEQMRDLDRLGIPYEVVPGVSSFQAAAAALRVELTAPGISQTVILTRAAGRTPLPPEQDLARLAAARATMCIFLSVQKMDEVARALAPFYGEDCPVAVVRHASRPDQQIVRGALAGIARQVAEAGIAKTAMIIVGRALDDGHAGHAAASKLYDAAFSHAFREASAATEIE